MSRRKEKPTPQPRDVTPYWESRGYRSDIAAVKPPPATEDPRGEEAYQRAFAEAAKKVPPRLPNPSHYPNSPSAVNYMQKREESYSTRPEKRPNPDYEPPIPDMYHRPGADPRQTLRQYRNPDQSPALSPGKPFTTSREASNSPASHHSLHSLNQLAPSIGAQAPPQYGAPPTNNDYFNPPPFNAAPFSSSGPRLAPMEPSAVGPAGPINKLR